MTIKSYKNYFKTKRIVNNKNSTFYIQHKLWLLYRPINKTNRARKLFKKDGETDVEGGGGCR